MINSVKNSINFNIFSKNHKSKPMHFGNKKDVFVSSKTSETMQNKKYTQQNNSINIDEIIEKYTEKTEIMPTIMDRIMFGIKKYISGQSEIQEFCKNFVDDTLSLANGISLREGKNEFVKSYAPEIKLIKNTNSLCNDFIKEKISKEKFDGEFEKNVFEYINDDTVRQKYFFE